MTLKNLKYSSNNQWPSKQKPWPGDGNYDEGRQSLLEPSVLRSKGKETTPFKDAGSLIHGMEVAGDGGEGGRCGGKTLHSALNSPNIRTPTTQRQMCSVRREGKTSLALKCLVSAYTSQDKSEPNRPISALAELTIH